MARKKADWWTRALSIAAIALTLANFAWTVTIDRAGQDVAERQLALERRSVDIQSELAAIERARSGANLTITWLNIVASYVDGFSQPCYAQALVTVTNTGLASSALAGVYVTVFDNSSKEVLPLFQVGPYDSEEFVGDPVNPFQPIHLPAFRDTIPSAESRTFLLDFGWWTADWKNFTVMSVEVVPVLGIGDVETTFAVAGLLGGASRVSAMEAAPDSCRQWSRQPANQ